MGIFLGIRYYSTRAARWLDSACALAEATGKACPVLRDSWRSKPALLEVGCACGAVGGRDDLTGRLRRGSPQTWGGARPRSGRRRRLSDGPLAPGKPAAMGWRAPGFEERGEQGP